MLYTALVSVVASVAVAYVRFRLTRPRLPSTQQYEYAANAADQPTFDVHELDFACVDPGGYRRSLVWRFQARGDDVYLAPGLYFGAPQPSNYHISLHRDGKCHRTFDRKFSLTSFFKPLGLASRQTRHWRRPPTPPEGSARAYRVVVLPDQTGHAAPKAEPSLALTFLSPGPGKCAVLELAYSTVPPSRFNAPGGMVLGCLALRSGQRVYLVVSEQSFDAASYHLPKASVRGQPLQDAATPMPEHIRTVLFVDVPEGSTGVPQALDIAATYDPSTQSIETLVPPAML